ncbi:hypothetical protein SI65_00875 [Aspergillus cristatus]|uniref:GST N-terminal domain-containing protein n=1 Tax=Aspergillus cristatus TaxID=573508 RepID=A0A1E3BSE2_ASPCR|nr:hypothetical protein SI65_00875 [Aspergillus cristatus]
MPSDQYLLYDLASRAPGLTWSPNPWKTRLLLNFKGLSFQTQWLEYPEIKPELENHTPPNPDGIAYTIPAIVCPDGTYMMDSRKIADYIEQRHPQPSLHLDSSYLAKVEDIWSRYMSAFCPIFIPQVPKRILNDASLEYWYTTRERMFGMPLDRLEKEQGGDRAWGEVEVAIREATALLKEQNGPFFMGDTPSYADLVWASILLFCQRLGTECFEETLKRSGDGQVHLDLLATMEPWSR